MDAGAPPRKVPKVFEKQGGAVTEGRERPRLQFERAGGAAPQVETMKMAARGSARPADRDWEPRRPGGEREPPAAKAARGGRGGKGRGGGEQERATGAVGGAMFKRLRAGLIEGLLGYMEGAGLVQPVAAAATEAAPAEDKEQDEEDKPESADDAAAAAEAAGAAADAAAAEDDESSEHPLAHD